MIRRILCLGALLLAMLVMGMDGHTGQHLEFSGQGLDQWNHIKQNVFDVNTKWLPSWTTETRKLVAFRWNVTSGASKSKYETNSGTISVFLNAQYRPLQFYILSQKVLFTSQTPIYLRRIDNRTAVIAYQNPMQDRMKYCFMNQPQGMLAGTTQYDAPYILLVVDLRNYRLLREIGMDIPYNPVTSAGKPIVAIDYLWQGTDSYPNLQDRG